MNYRVSLAAVNIPHKTYGRMKQALDTTRIAQGPFVEEFEEMLCQYTGARHCVVVSNGTLADAVAVAVMKELYGIQRVIVPALTFIAQPNSVRYNELEVVFEDVREDWLLDMDKFMRENRPDRQTLVFNTDLMGCVAETHPAPYEEMHWIEDACEAFGSRREGRQAGTFGEMGTYSFFPSHTISTGEGGAIVTNDAEKARLARSMRAHGFAGMEPQEKFRFPYFGYNARMTDMQAAVGVSVMECVQDYVLARRENFARMQARLGIFALKDDEQVVPHGYPLGFPSEEARNKAMQKIIQAGIECRRFFSCIPTSECQYLEMRRYPVAEWIARTHLYVPCHQNMSIEDVDYVCDVVEAL